MSEYTTTLNLDNWDFKYGNHEISKRQAQREFREDIEAQGLELVGELTVSGVIENPAPVPGKKSYRAHIKVHGHVKPKES
jgi:hypothetical protein